MHFDARAAKALPASNSIVIQGCPGLRLEATATGKSWVYRYKSPVDGRMRQIKFGVWPSTDFTDASKLWKDLRAVRDAGRDPSLERKQARLSRKAEVKEAKEGVYTVGRLVDDYLSKYIDKQRDPANAKVLRSRMTRGTAAISQLQPASVTRSVAFETIQALAATPMAATSLRRELGGAWEYAYDSGMLKDDVPNWWSQILKGKLKTKGALRDGEHKGGDKRVLTDGEIKRLFTTDFRLFSPAIQDVLTLYMWTCARGGEICALHASHINEEDGCLWATLLKSQTKNKKRARATDFRVPLLGRAEEVVRRRLHENPGGYLFPGKHASGHILQTNVQTQVHSKQPYSKTRPDWARERLFVTHWSPHDLRRSGRTMLARLGCPEDVGESILGHVIAGVAGVYNRHRYDAEKMQWLQVLADKLESIVQTADT